jgi:hypothetical protein
MLELLLFGKIYYLAGGLCHMDMNICLRQSHAVAKLLNVRDVPNPSSQMLQGMH